MSINVGVIVTVTFLCNSSFLKSCRGNERLIMWGAAQRDWAPQPCPAERREPAADRAPFFPTFCTSSQADGWSALSQGRHKLPRLCCEMMRTMWVLEEIHDDALSPVIVFGAIRRRKCATGPITHCKQFLLRTGNGSFAREDRVHQTRRLTLIGCGVCRGGVFVVTAGITLCECNRPKAPGSEVSVIAISPHYTQLPSTQRNTGTCNLCSTKRAFKKGPKCELFTQRATDWA